MPNTPGSSQLNGFRGLGQLASSEIIQWASLPWIPAASLSVTDDYGLRTVAQLISYEMPLILSMVGVVILTGSLSLNEIVNAQSVPFILVQPVGSQCWHHVA